MKEGEKIHGEETGQKEERPLEENTGNEEVQTSDFEKLEEQLAQLENEKKSLGG